MFLTIFILAGAFANAEWELSLDMYSRLPIGMATEAKAGDIYVLDYREARIAMIGSDGKLKALFLNKGNGPGEVAGALESIYIHQDRLYVSSRFKIIQLSLTGDFLAEFKPPSLKFSRKIDNGWILFSNLDAQTSRTSSIEWRSEDFSSKKTLFEWTNSSNRMDHIFLREDPLIAFSDNNTFMYLRKPGQAEVIVYDLQIEETVQSIKGFKSNPIDSEDETFLLRTNRRNKTKIPERYPPLWKISFTDGKLITRTIRKAIGMNIDFRVFDGSNEQIDSEISPRVLERVIKSDHTYARLLLFDGKEEQVVVVNWPKSELNDRYDAWQEEKSGF